MGNFWNLWNSKNGAECQKCMRARLIKYVCSFLPTQFAINSEAYYNGRAFCFHMVVPILIWRGAPIRCHSVFLVCKGYIRRSPFFHDIFCVSLFTLFLFIASFSIVMNDFMNDWMNDWMSPLGIQRFHKFSSPFLYRWLWTDFDLKTKTRRRGKPQKVGLKVSFIIL